jgi:hypothetical protein
MKSKVLQRKMFRDPSEDENVGIMQGFMDSLGDMLSGEGDMSEDDDDSPSGAPDRTPGSPEILMNTLRGDMRSVDARVEELADMVGYNAASSTPLEVLALLQPVLKQQGIAALQTSSAMPTSTAMSPSPAMAPAPSTPVPPVPAQGGGIATLPQGDMGQGPPPMPMQMADGGVVQHFQNGAYVQTFREGAVDPITLEALPAPTDEESASYYPNDLIQMGISRRNTLLDQEAARVPGLQEKMDEYAPIYRTLMGEDGESAKAQLLFALSQRALNYAGNVNDQGQALRGSQGARLAGAFSSMPAAVGALAADKQKQDRAINLAALEAGQRDIDSIRAANAQLSSEQTRAFLDMAKTKPADVGGLPAAGLTPAQQLAFFARHGDAYGDGTLSPMLTNAMEAALSDYTQQQIVMGPKGYELLVGKTLPAFMVNKVNQRRELFGVDVVPSFPTSADSGQGTTSADSGQGTASPVLGQGTSTATTPIPELLGAIPAPRPDPSRPFPPPNPLFSGANGVYTDSTLAPNMFNQTSGASLVPLAFEFLASTPLIGPWIDENMGNRTREEIAKRGFLQKQSNAILDAFSTAPEGRLYEGERRDLQAQLDTLPGLWNNPAAYRRKLIEIDSALEGRMSNNFAIYNNPEASSKSVQDAEKILLIQNNARVVLGVPPRIESIADPRLAQIPEGAPIIYEGKERFMPVRLTGLDDSRLASLPVGTLVYVDGKLGTVAEGL